MLDFNVKKEPSHRDQSILYNPNLSAMKPSFIVLFSITLFFNLYPSLFSQQEISGTFKTEIFDISNEEFTPDSGITYTYNSSSDSLKDTKVVYGWDQTGRITMYASYKWDTIGNFWKGAYRNDTEYDLIGNRTGLKFFSWDTSSGDWSLTNKIDYLYNDSNDLSQESQYLIEPDQINGNLISRQNYEYTYKDHYTEYIVISWINEMMQEEPGDTTTKTELYYNQDSQLVLKRTSLWQKGHGVWRFVTMDSMKYDENKKLIEDSYYSWDIANQKWTGNFRTEIKEYTGNNYSLLLYYSWESLTESWNLNYREELQYSQSGKQTSLLGSQWRNSSTWANTLKVIFNYDYHDNEYMESWYHLDENTQSWFISTRLYYFYPYSMINVTENYSHDFLRIYPSVMEEYLNLITDQNGLTGELYDMNGRIVKSFPIYNGLNTQYTGNLKPGIYIFKTNHYTCKLVKR